MDFECYFLYIFSSYFFYKAIVLHFQQSYFQDQWSKITLAPNAIEVWETGINKDELAFIGTKSVCYPKDFVSLIV